MTAAAPIHEMPMPRGGKPPMVALNDCNECTNRQLCIWSHLDPLHQDSARDLGRTMRNIGAGQAIFRAGDPFRNLYVTRAGSSKTVLMRADGRHQITGFQLAGEFLGLDAIASSVHPTDAIALESSVVCIFPYQNLERLADSLRAVRGYLNQAMSEEISREANLLMLLGHLSAEERVAAFLVNLSDRYAVRGYSPLEFNLLMNREEIGCYLGMKLETVSRMMARLHDRGLIDLQARQIRIKDLASLRAA
ncbi:helix-turn-helix domain-containing protein [Bordetella sp. FB-8]|uniref:helix-turn-helix domain-containing protein n=1 Tax=Bordetella sp. FB-8 TaxID=1159870 RepID=UPI0003616F7F|nr:helix-turn-helix domain-containing protein [Bordetella sp. FB-8]